eukprot:NODE_5698_length_558_cov_59.858546_g4961_i0.p2 GENE.NODE_5698_length_558_cov_59.858546_g4961_i0~~NODE_5698_length_558_cov_59.858546_g4961_i0.p2  ORF type:complete len:134 (+),score=58.30 NODE_5698_length_558_cov_59.858546_g4961_i0:40-402(+)
MERDEVRLARLEESAMRDGMELDRDDVDNLVVRMHDQEIEMRTQRREVLEHKYCPPLPELKLSQRQTQSTVDRMYKKALEDRAERRRRLASEHLAKPVKGVRLSKQQLVENAARLTGPSV